MIADQIKMLKSAFRATLPLRNVCSSRWGCSNGVMFNGRREEDLVRRTAYAVLWSRGGVVDVLVTHLQGPHQSVCWLRPKRARHFLGEPGSEHNAQHAQNKAVRKQKKKKGLENQPEERQNKGRKRHGEGGDAPKGGGGCPFRESHQVKTVSSSKASTMSEHRPDTRTTL